jgi:hypothetical protein
MRFVAHSTSSAPCGAKFWSLTLNSVIGISSCFYYILVQCYLVVAVKQNIKFWQLTVVLLRAQKGLYNIYPTHHPKHFMLAG